MAWRTITAASVIACAACSSGSKTTASASASSVPARAAGVVVDADGTWLDGKRVDAAPGDPAKKIDGLFEALKQRRDAFLASHPGGALEPLALALPKDSSCGAGMSAAVTLLYSGFRRIKLDLGGTLHDLAMAAPGPPDEDDDREKVVHAKLLTSGSVELRLDRCLAPFDVVPLANVGEAVKAELGGGTMRLPTTCEEGVPFSSVIAVYEGATSGWKPADFDTPTAGLSGDAACEGGGVGATDPQPIALPDKWKGEVRLGAVSVSGALTGADVKAGEAKVHDKVAGCYAAALSGNHNLQGTVVVSLEVSKAGAVYAAGAGGSLPERGAIQCVKDQLAKAVFPSAKSRTRVSIPIVFAPGD